MLSENWRFLTVAGFLWLPAMYISSLLQWIYIIRSKGKYISSGDFFFIPFRPCIAQISAKLLSRKHKSFTWELTLITSWHRREASESLGEICLLQQPSSRNFYLKSSSYPKRDSLVLELDKKDLDRVRRKKHTKLFALTRVYLVSVPRMYLTYILNNKVSTKKFGTCANSQKLDKMWNPGVTQTW